MNGSLSSSRAPSRQTSMSGGTTIPEVPLALPSGSRDMSATDLVRLASQMDADAMMAQRARDSPGGSPTSSSVAEWQAGSLGTFQAEAARRQQASSAHAVGEAAGSANAQSSLPALEQSASPLLPAAASRQHSGGLPGDIKAASARSQTSSDNGSTWLSRVTANTDALRKMFELPPWENVMDDFICALQKKLLLQGRIYVFEHYVCFHSNVFGYVTNKAIPLKEVTAVRKRKNLGIPNSIEIHWGERRREFFTSFLSREDAFRLIVAAWHQSAPDKAAAQMFSTGKRKPVKTARSATSAEFASALAAARGNGGGENAAPAEGQGSFLTKSANLLMRPMVSVQRRVSERAGGRAGSATGEHHISADGNGHGGLAGRFPNERVSVATTAERSSSWHDSTPSDDGDATATPDNGSEDGDADSVTIRDHWAPAAAAPPPLAPGMQPLVDTQLRGITMQEMCRRFLSDDSTFYTDFHTARGDEQAIISPWRNHQPLGRVRELQFVTMLKSKIGPPKAMCYQTQRYRMYEGDRLVFETSQVMPDIPYGDCFTVEARWDISPMTQSPGQPPALSVKTHVMVDFAKTTIWRKAIESGVINSCRGSHEEWLAAAQKTIDEGALSAPAATPPGSGAPGGASAGGPATPGASSVAPNIAAPPGSPAHLAGLVELLPREHRAAIGRLLRGEDARSPSASPQVKRRLSLGSSRARPESGGGRARGGLLTKRQWVLLGLSAAIVSLQLLILWRFAALAGGGGGSAVVASAAAPVQLQPPLDLSSTAPLLGGGGPAGGAAYGSTYPAGASEAAAADGAWVARMQLLAGDADVMRQRLELLARDVAAAAAAAVPGAAVGFAAGDASCAAPGGACAADTAGA